MEAALIGHKHPAHGRSFALIWTCWASSCFHPPTVVGCVFSFCFIPGRVRPYRLWEDFLSTVEQNFNYFNTAKRKFIAIIKFSYCDVCILCWRLVGLSTFGHVTDKSIEGSIVFLTQECITSCCGTDSKRTYGCCSRTPDIPILHNYWPPPPNCPFYWGIRAPYIIHAGGSFITIFIFVHDTADRQNTTDKHN